MRIRQPECLGGNMVGYTLVYALYSVPVTFFLIRETKNGMDTSLPGTVNGGKRMECCQLRLETEKACTACQGYSTIR